jgi:AAA15 family ATPase/GTPase
MKGIGFQNFKVFKDKQWFDFRPITILTGTNNSGKSSIINGLKLLQENLSNKPGIDELLKIQFSTKNPLKQGTIRHFINNTNKENEESFSFFERHGELEYEIELKVVDSFEDYAEVSGVRIRNFKSDTLVLHLIVNKGFPTPEIELQINYDYFISHLTRCIATTKLFNRKFEELEAILERFKAGTASIEQVQQFAKELTTETGVMIDVDESDVFKIGTMESRRVWAVNIALEAYDSIGVFGEIGVIFVKADNGYSLPNIATDAWIEENYPMFTKGIYLDPGVLWKLNPEDRFDFERNLCKMLDETDIKRAYAKLSEAVFLYLSTVRWEVEFTRYAIAEIDFHERDCFVRDFILKIPDLGVVTSEFEMIFNEDETDRRAFVDDKDIVVRVNHNKIESQRVFKNDINKEKFFDIYHELWRHILDKYVQVDDLGKYSPEYKIVVNDIVAKDFQNSVLDQLLTMVAKVDLSINNAYVSSSRYVQNRLVSFNDVSDLKTNLFAVINSKLKDEHIVFINKWLKIFEIADEFVAEGDAESGGFKPYLLIGGKKTILQDFGLGTNQLISIVFALAFYQTTNFPANLADGHIVKRTIVIEEPEANLHPAMQSKLADLFADAVLNHGIQLVLETHSEYLIRKFQYLVGSSASELQAKDLIIYYMYKPNHPQVLAGNVDQVETIEFDEFGRLSKEFGTGFFDEADNIAMEIFLMTQSQKN